MHLDVCLFIFSPSSLPSPLFLFLYPSFLFSALPLFSLALQDSHMLSSSPDLNVAHAATSSSPVVDAQLPPG